MKKTLWKQIESAQKKTGLDFLDNNRVELLLELFPDEGSARYNARKTYSSLPCDTEWRKPRVKHMKVTGRVLILLASCIRP